MNKQFILRAFPDSRQDRLIGTALLVIALFVALMGAWSIIASVPEVAKTRGEILPKGGDIHVIQSLSGGKILRVLVQEGQIVDKGQPIANIDQSVSEGDIRQLEVKRNDIIMRIERLRALQEQREPDFGENGNRYPGMAREQRDLYQSQLALMTSKLSEIDEQMTAKEADMDSAIKQRAFLDLQVSTIDKEVVMFTSAVKRGLSPRAELLEKEETLAELKKEREALVGRKLTAEKELLSLQEKRKAMEYELHTGYRQESSELVEQLREVEEQLLQANATLGQNALVAQEAGIIKSLPNAKVGAVIQPGGVVAELVPSDQPLIVEVRVSPRDIGFVAVGQQVLIKVDAYDYSRFGAVEGEVVRVSPATFKDERTGEPYFKAVIEPKSTYVGLEEKGRQIKVGMTVEADITTGHKTIFQYLLKPVYTTVDTALTER